MAVYVDSLKPCPRSSKWPYTQSAHLLADTDDELHAFAARLGLKRSWFQQSPPASHPHYDLAPRRHAAALGLGAELVDRVRLVEIVRRRRNNRG